MMEDARAGGIDEDHAERLADRYDEIRSTMPEAEDEMARVAGATPSKYAFERLDELVVDRSCQWLIKGVLPAAGTVILYGPPGSGKSFLALDAALHLACGIDWMGYRTRGRAGVVYVAAEGPQGFRHRAVAAREHLSVPAGAPFAIIAAEPDVGGRGSTDADDLRKAILEQADAAGFTPALVVFDTLSRCIGNLDESSTSDMNLLVRRVARLGRELGACVLLVHHSGKDASRGLRGSSTLQGAADAIWSVSRDADADVRRLVLEKVKDGADGDAKDFTLLQVDLGQDEDGDPITSCVVERAVGSGVVTPKAEAAGGLTPAQRANAVVAAVASLCELEGLPAPEDVTTSDAGSKVTVERKLRDFLRSRICQTSTPEASAARMVQKAVKSAREKGWISAARKDGAVWLTSEGKAAAASTRPAGQSQGGA